MSLRKKIYVAGHRGLVGSAIVRRLRAAGEDNIVVRTRAELELTDAAATRAFFQAERPARVYLAAAKVGGIMANATYPADFIRENLQVQTNVIQSAWEVGVERFVFMGSSCIYPKLAPQPIKEEYLLTGPLEPTNIAYAVAKIAGIASLDAYQKQFGFHGISLMPTNLYGPGDSFDLATSHVLPALIRRFHDAKVAGVSAVTLWGTGEPRREFLHVDDLADAAVFLTDKCEPGALVNVGMGDDLTIRALAETVADVVGWKGDLVFDRSKPDGTPRKLLDVSRAAALGWRAKTPLRAGLESTYRWYLESAMHRER